MLSSDVVSRISLMSLANAALLLGTASSVIICALAWSGKLRPCLMLDIGLLFEVIGAFSIATLENSTPMPADGWLRGVSGVALWITFFIFVVPSTLGKTALAAISSALMGPLALLIYSSVYRVALPAGGSLFSMFLPDVLAAVWAIILSRFVYGLGRDLGQARRMGYYELIEKLGRGGMGEVWRAKHRLLARPAAIKLISPESAGIGSEGLTATMVRRFELEAQMTATLQSQHTIQLYDFGVTDDGAFYYVMEYLNGLDLETLVNKYGPLPAERVVHLLSQVCESLDEAHKLGMVHRDIKPANIIAGLHGINYDFVKVLDFGLAKFKQETNVTVSGLAGGTPAFMAPEAALGEGAVDGRADLYALGAVGYWLLTGKLVFEAETAYATVLDHIRKTPVPPSRRTELEIPASLERIILRCLEKDPAKRPESARELAWLLKDVEVSEPWTQERAERWWQAHRPEVTRPAPIQIEEPAVVEVA